METQRAKWNPPLHLIALQPQWQGRTAGGASASGSGLWRLSRSQELPHTKQVSPATKHLNYSGTDTSLQGTMTAASLLLPNLMQVAVMVSCNLEPLRRMNSEKYNSSLSELITV